MFLLLLLRSCSTKCEPGVCVCVYKNCDILKVKSQGGEKRIPNGRGRKILKEVCVCFRKMWVIAFLLPKQFVIGLCRWLCMRETNKKWEEQKGLVSYRKPTFLCPVNFSQIYSLFKYYKHFLLWALLFETSAPMIYNSFFSY